ncbi:hypothetical protein PUNSTDRAFT_135646 [Punctularia strigosozonata HHB-11173 SS5]|uniref:uncharacterized protein n=1 Tax=Punctularia strigosozonata (strain HHB-11173) TaxID=741275 RepID=UPI0004417192|nr:uncharacterized protein PUNSTDRAFT_135646 [Punctularia strigosozonata HHB-11173 SS5]EIN06946.1 hypothetical protein PUNSTDRAFT_135646 [Punctularia strigosozonata HHB-11173 SS5]
MPRGKMSKLQTHWLQLHLPKYRDHRKQHTLHLFWPVAIAGFLKEFPVNPSDAELRSVNGDIAKAMVLPEVNERRMAVTKQVKNWFPNHARSTPSGFGKSKLLELVLAGKRKKKQTSWQAYSTLHWKRLKPKFDVDWANRKLLCQQKGEDPPVLVAFRAEWLANRLEKESDAVKEQVEAYREDEAKDTDSFSDEEDDARAHRFMRNMPNVAHTVQNFLVGLREHTNLVGGVLLAGPDYADDGKIKTSFISVDRTLQGAHFSAFHPRFQQDVIDHFEDWANNVFTKQECAALAEAFIKTLEIMDPDDDDDKPLIPDGTSAGSASSAKEKLPPESEESDDDDVLVVLPPSESSVNLRPSEAPTGSTAEATKALTGDNSAIDPSESSINGAAPIDRSSAADRGSGIHAGHAPDVTVHRLSKRPVSAEEQQPSAPREIAVDHDAVRRSKAIQPAQSQLASVMRARPNNSISAATGAEFSDAAKRYLKSRQGKPSRAPSPTDSFPDAPAPLEDDESNGDLMDDSCFDSEADQDKCLTQPAHSKASRSPSSSTSPPTPPLPSGTPSKDAAEDVREDNVLATREADQSPLSSAAPSNCGGAHPQSSVLSPSPSVQPAQAFTIAQQEEEEDAREANQALSSRTTKRSRRPSAKAAEASHSPIRPTRRANGRGGHPTFSLAMTPTDIISRVIESQGVFPDWFVDAVKYLDTVCSESSCKGFEDMIANFILFQTSRGYVDDSQRLRTGSRPDFVSKWNKTRNYAAVPKISADSLGAWRQWWCENQPAWRGLVWPPKCEGDLADWSTLKSGKNGVSMLVVSLAWFAQTACGAKRAKDFASTVADVSWALRRAAENRMSGNSVLTETAGTKRAIESPTAMPKPAKRSRKTAA